MQNQPIQIPTPQEAAKIPTVSLWSRSGPLLLLGAFAIFLFKCAPFYWPLTLTAFLGYAATRLFKKGGLYLSLIALGCISIFIIRSGPELLWSALLSGSIAVSLLLVYLGGKDAEALAHSREEEILTLKESCRILEKQNREIKASIAHENRENIAERQRLNALYSEAALALVHNRQSLETVEKERSDFSDKCISLSQQIASHQQKESAFQRALDDALAQLTATKHQLSEVKAQLESPKVVKDEPQSITLQEEGDANEKLELSQVQSQFALLREQFEEKSETLDKARKELFKVENDYLALQKAWEEKTLESPEEDLFLLKDLKALEQECEELENQVFCLQDIISSMLLPKKRGRAKKEKEIFGEVLPELLQKKIDGKTPVES